MEKYYVEIITTTGEFVENGKAIFGLCMDCFDEDGEKIKTTWGKTDYSNVKQYREDGCYFITIKALCKVMDEVRAAINKELDGKRICNRVELSHWI